MSHPYKVFVGDFYKLEVTDRLRTGRKGWSGNTNKHLTARDGLLIVPGATLDQNYALR